MLLKNEVTVEKVVLRIGSALTEVASIIGGRLGAISANFDVDDEAIYESLDDNAQAKSPASDASA